MYSILYTHCHCRYDLEKVFLQFFAMQSKEFFSKIWSRNFNKIYGKLQFASQMYRCKEPLTS